MRQSCCLIAPAGTGALSPGSMDSAKAAAAGSALGRLGDSSFGATALKSDAMHVEAAGGA